MAETEDLMKTMSEVMFSKSKKNEFRITERYFSNDETRLSIGIANIHPVARDIEANKAKILRSLEIFKEKGVNWAVFPELCLSGYFWEDEKECWSYMDQAVIENHVHWINDTLKPMLDENTRAITLNSIRRGNERKYLNTTHIITAAHDIFEPELRYDKVFLPQLEQRYTETGKDDRLVIDSAFGRVGFTTCYDICFSQLLLEYSKIDNVDFIIEIAAWRTMSDRDYPGMNVGTDVYYSRLWDILLPAAAALNQVWIIACNAVGRHEITGARFCGGSGLWAPSGLPLLQASRINEELLIIHNIDILGQREAEVDEQDYKLDFNSIYRVLEDKRTFTRLDD
ncbi:carbon-nitrogen hydrolase family protein [Chloroflexota bacterium]